MVRLFEAMDKTGRRIYLTDERWAHINEEHPEVSRYMEEFQELLKNPTKVRPSQFDAKIHHFYKYYKSNAKYLLLIVKYLNGEGFIITAYFTRKML